MHLWKNHFWKGIIFAAMASLFCGGTCASAAIARAEQGIYEIVSGADRTFGIDIRSCTVRDRDAVQADDSLGALQLFERGGANQQKFYLSFQPDHTFTITSLSSGKLLTCGDVEESSPEGEDTENSRKIRRASVSCETLKPVEEKEEAAQEDPAEKPEAAEEENPQSAVPTVQVDPSQKWLIYRAADGNGWIIRSKSGLALTCTKDQPKNGVSLVLKGYDGGEDQRWDLEETLISETMYQDTDHVNPYSEKGISNDAVIWIKFGGRLERLDRETLENWMKETDDHRYVLDDEKVVFYVNELASRYDTQGVPRKFVTTGGSEITLTKGNYGWKMDVDETAALLRDYVKAGESKLFEPEWDHRGASFEEGDDIGGSYVEIALEEQRLWLYVDGKRVLATDIVSGTYGTDRQTPGGVYGLYYKQSPAVLRGPGYESPVTYWMPFNGGIGLHDANWRNKFGGEIFRTNGSHGCINLPTDAARRIYEVIYVGFPIVLYN